MKYFPLVILLYLFVLDYRVPFEGERRIASISDSQVERFLDQALFTMSSDAVRSIEEATNVTLGSSVREIDVFIKNAIKKIKYKFVNPIKTALFRYPDAIVFATLYKIMKSAVLYPLLIYNGNAHLIPSVGMILLNADLWMGVYILVRNQIVNIFGRLKFGHSLDKLHKVRDAILQVEQSRHLSFHQIVVGGNIVTIDVKKDVFLDRFKKIEKKVFNQGVTVDQLEELVGDEKFIKKAIEYKGKPYIYNEILLSKILHDQDKTLRLTKLIAPKNMIDDNLMIQKYIKNSRLYIEKISSYLIGFDEGLNNKIKTDLGIRIIHAHPEVLSLKYQLWRYRRIVNKEIASLRVAEFELLASYLDGKNVNLTLFDKRLANSKKYIERKVVFLRALEKDLTYVDRLGDLKVLFGNLGQGKGRCFFLLQQLII